MQTIFWTFIAILTSAVAYNERNIVCYFDSSAPYRQGNGKLDINKINPHLCTHLIYQYIGVTSNGSIKVLDPHRDLSGYELSGSRNGFDKFNRLRGVNPSVKTLVSIGGWSQGSKTFSKVVGNAATRDAFAENIVHFTRKYGFDGFDFYWQYPNQRGGAESDKQKFVLLLKKLKRRFDKEGLILSAAVGAVEYSAKQSYNIPELVKYLDLINLIAWDMHGPWDKKTGIVAPLYAGSWENDEDQKNLNVNATVRYWLSQGAPAEKLMLGIPSFGHTFTLDNPKNKDVGAPAHSIGDIEGPYSHEKGTLGYNEICEAQLKGDWDVKLQEEQRVPYAIKGDQWVGYENPESIHEKTELINALGLGGAMIWTIDKDDFRGICGEKYSLLKTLNRDLRGGQTLSPTTKTKE